MRVREIGRLSELSALRADWERLFALTAGATFFHTLDWFEAYWRHYGQEQELRVLVIESAAGIEGIVPLVLKNEQTRVGMVRVLTYPLHDWGSFYSPLGQDQPAILQAALEHLRRRQTEAARRDWQLLDLRWIDPAQDQGATVAAMQRAGFPADERPWSRSAFVELSGDWEAYWSSRQSRWRNNVRRSERKLSEAGEVRYVRYRSGDTAGQPTEPRWDLYEICLAIAGRSWQSTANDGTTLSHEAVRDFLQDAHRAAAARGAIDVNLLYLNDAAAAFAYNYCHQGWVYGLRMGFDARLSRDGAGSVLLARMIEDSFRRGDRLIDLGAEYLEAKRFWLTSLRWSHRATHFSPTAPRAQVLRLKHWMQDWLATTTE